MRLAATLVRSVCLALILGVLVLHIPLDAIRPRPTGRLVSSCCGAGAVDAGAACGAAGDAVDDAASAPVPRDGCDQGCHCGCCGGLPLVSEASAGEGTTLPGVAAASLERRGARGARPHDVFHPPRA